MSFLRLSAAALAASFTLAVTAASASTFSLVTEADGTIAPVQSVNPGVYGVEIQGGQRGNWNVGVGTQTSNQGTFAQHNRLNWANASLDNPFRYTIGWTGTGVSVSIFDQQNAPLTTLSFNDDWQIGNTIRIGLKADAGTTFFSVDELNGEAVDFSWTLTNDSSFQNHFLTGAGLDQGFSMSGSIFLTDLGGSRRAVQVSMADFKATTVAPIPLPAAGWLLLGGIGALAAVRRRKRAA